MPQVINLPGDQVAQTIIDGIVDPTEAAANANFQQELLSQLEEITKHLQKLINHHRIITGVHSDDEGDF